jgi:predicted RNA-binding protein YlxR (DUF448 family)/ribosomal protein L7Ae-like RNA K-turn-binding protein
MQHADQSERPGAQRTCVGCRQSDDRTALLRLVLAGDPPQLVPDVSRRGGGRGVSVHPRRRCLDAAVRSGALRRGLRTQESADAAQLAGWASGQYRRRMDGLLSAAYRSGHAAIGTERVRDAIGRREATLLVVAGDAADNRRDLVEAAQRIGGSCLVHADKASLGKLFGRETVAVVAVSDPLIAEELQRAARCAAQLDAEAS